MPCIPKSAKCTQSNTIPLSKVAAGQCFLRDQGQYCHTNALFMLTTHQANAPHIAKTAIVTDTPLTCCPSWLVIPYIYSTIIVPGNKELIEIL